MITWLQTAFLKHNKIIFGALMVVVIVTFVLYVGPYGMGGGGDRGMRVERRDFFGFNLNNANDQQAMIQSAMISAQLNPDLGIDRNSLEHFAYARAAALGIANQIGIPAPGQSRLDRFIRSRDVFMDPETGRFSAAQYQEWLTMVRMSLGMSEAAIARVLKDDYRITQVLEVLSGPGFQLPFEQRQNYVDGQTSWEIMIATKSLADFEVDLDPEVEVLREFYNSNTARYRVADRLQVQAAQFQANRFMHHVATPGEMELEAFFDRFSFRYQNFPTEENPDVEPVTLDDPEVRQRVINDFRMERATRLARESSDAFLGELWDAEVARNSPDLPSIVERFGGVLREVAPFARGEAAFDPMIPNTTRQNAWMFVEGDRFYTDIGQTRDGAVVLLVQELIPAHLPPFEEVSERVRADWIQQERRRLFADSGEEVRSDLLAELDLGADFEQAASARGLAVERLDTFTGVNPPRALLMSNAWSQVRNMQPGELSRMTMEANQGTFVFVIDRILPDVDFADPEVLADLEAAQLARRATAGWLIVSELANARLASLGDLF